MSGTDQPHLCLLSLDGGGVRGLSTLFVLQRIVEGVNRKLKDRARDNGAQHVDKKPYELFDLIGGTSTGGLIAIMLGRLHMDVDECITEYTALIEDVFGEPKRLLPFNPFNFTVQARFSSEKLKEAIDKIVLKYGGLGAQSSDLFDQGSGTSGCKVFVCATSKEAGGPVRIRSYCPEDRLRNEPVTISQAALATSAATTFFDPVLIGGCSYIDGAFGANNPAVHVESEAKAILCGNRSDWPTLIKCFVSIGTGNPGISPVFDSANKLLKSMRKMVTETEKVAEEVADRWEHHVENKAYFRLNVEQGLQGVGLQEHKKKSEIKAATLRYLDLHRQRLAICDCVRNLAEQSMCTAAVPLNEEGHEQELIADDHDLAQRQPQILSSSRARTPTQPLTSIQSPTQLRSPARSRSPSQSLAESQSQSPTPSQSPTRSRPPTKSPASIQSPTQLRPPAQSRSPNQTSARSPSQSSARSRSSVATRHYIVPFAENPHFVGRQQALDELRDLFFRQSACTVAIVGPEGIGKTQVALSFAQWVRGNKEDHSVFWALADSTEGFDQAFVEILNTVKIPMNGTREDPKETVKRYLQSEEAGPWLFIINNTDDSYPFQDLQEYLPVSPQGRILITASMSEYVRQPGPPTIHLTRMSLDEATQLLFRSMKERTPLPADSSVVTHLLKNLDFHPLAIAQAAAYINVNNTSLSGYLANFLYNMSCTEYARSTEPGYHKVELAVAVPWLMSYGKIRPFDMQLLKFISWLQHNAVPCAILLSGEPEHQVQLGKSIEALCSYGFLTRREGGQTLDMHHLIHHLSEILFHDSHLDKGTAELAIRRLIKACPRAGRENLATWRAYWPHGMDMLYYPVASREDRHILATRMSAYLTKDGNHIRDAYGLEWLETIGSWFQCYSPKDDRDRLDVEYALAELYGFAGQLELGRGLVEKIAIIRGGLVKKHDLSLLRCRALMARFDYRSGRTEEAIQELKSVFKLWPTSHWGKFGIQLEICEAFVKKGQSHIAVEILEETWDEVRIAKEDRTAYGMMVEFAYLKAGGELGVLTDERLSMLLVGTETSRVYIEDNPDAGLVYWSDGQLLRAIQLMELATRAEKELLNKPRTETSHHLAILYADAGQVDRAVELILDVVRAREGVFDKDDPLLARSRRDLARMRQMARSQATRQDELCQ